MKKIISLALLLISIFFTCTTMQTRQEIENELLSTIREIEPLAKEKEDIKASLFQSSYKAKHEPASSKAENVTKMVQMQVSAASGKIYQRNVNLDAQIQPYLYKIGQTKYKYISRFGTIEYNNFIRSKGYEWGLGIYW